jgi:hypothetical protein
VAKSPTYLPYDFSRRRFDAKRSARDPFLDRERGVCFELWIAPAGIGASVVLEGALDSDRLPLAPLD